MISPGLSVTIYPSLSPRSPKMIWDCSRSHKFGHQKFYYTQEFAKDWGPSTWVLSAWKAAGGRALKLSEFFALKTEMQVTWERSLLYQILTCACSAWMSMLPLKYLPVMPKLRFYTEWTLLFLQADFSLGPGIPYFSRENEQKWSKIAIKCLLDWSP